VKLWTGSSGFRLGKGGGNLCVNELRDQEIHEL